MRFPEFSGEWEECTLGDIAIITKGSGISKSDLSKIGKPCILYGELYTKYKNEIVRSIISCTDLDDATLVKSKSGDVIIPSSGESAIDIATARCVTLDNVLLGGDLNIIRLHKNDGSFFSYQLNGVRKMDIARVAQGSSVIHLYGVNLKKLDVFYPSIEEQIKIASLLSLIDERIATQMKIIEELKVLKSAIGEELFSPKTNSDNWQEYKLNQLVDRVIRKNIDNESANILTISAQHGLVDQFIFFNKQIASQNISGYYLLYNGDFAYNKSYSSGYPWGAVKRLNCYDKGVVSTLYICFRPKAITNSEYLTHYFETTKWHQGISDISGEGARNHGLLNMSISDFFNTKHYLPSYYLQEKTSKTMISICSKCSLEEQLLNKYTKQKSYLLSQMFI